MRRLAAAAISCAILLTATPARACDPYWDWCGYEEWYDPYWDLPAYEEPSWSWSWWDEPVYEPVYEPLPLYAPEPVYVAAPVYVPPPVYVEPVLFAEPTYVAAARPMPAPQPAPAPAWSDPVVWKSPGSDVLDAATVAAPALAPVAMPVDPATLAAQYGLHLVNEVWTADTVTTQGLLTTYASTTASMNAGTAARVVASVGTGESSPYDALLFNGRTSLSDGRSVKGEVYANHVWNGYDWVFDKYVFFQDDLETARLAQTPIPTPPPAAVQPPTATPPPSVAPVAATSPVPSTVAAPAYVAPVTGDVPPAAGEATPGATSQPRQRAVRAGIALAPQADPLGRVEVLRGRRVPLWVRVTVDDVPSRVASWRLVSGDLIALGPVTGTGDDPLVATWRSITAGAPLVVVIRATVEVEGEGPREIDAAIDVVVRAPALVE